MKCPRDAKELELATYDQASIYTCSSCLGCWIDIDANAFSEKVQEQIKSRAKGRERCSEVECPHDGHSLLELVYYGISIDVCPDCYGIWLDEGELEKVRNKSMLGKEPSDMTIAELGAIELVSVAVKMIVSALSTDIT